MGGSNSSGSGQEASTIIIVSDESGDSLEAMFTFGEGDLARGCVGTQLLIWSGAGLMVGWSSGPE